jgi:hypothetical protein
MSSCSTIIHIESVSKKLPVQWSASVLETLDKLDCSTPQKLNSQVLVSLCSGIHKSHGSIVFLDKNLQQLKSQLIPSIDPLALSKSVTEKSPLLVVRDKFFMGTEDGRVISMNSQGKILSQFHFPLHTWVQAIVESQGEFVVLSSQLNQVKISRFDANLKLLQTISIHDARIHASLNHFQNQFVVSTDKCHIIIFDHELNQTNNTKLCSEAELGEPLVSGKSIYVGSSLGEFYKLTDNRVSRVNVGKGPISSAPIKTDRGVWVAYDEEGVMRLFGPNLKLKKTIELPMKRSLKEFSLFNYYGNSLIRTSTHDSVILISSDGEILKTIELSDLDRSNQWVVFGAEPEDSNLLSKRSPASQNLD